MDLSYTPEEEAFREFSCAGKRAVVEMADRIPIGKERVHVISVPTRKRGRLLRNRSPIFFRTG